MVTYQRDNGEYRIDFEKFHNVYDVDTPEFSAKEMDELRVSALNPGHIRSSVQASGMKPENAYQVVSVEEVENRGQTPYATITNASCDSHPSVLPMVDEAIQRLRIDIADPATEPLVSGFSPRDKNTRVFFSDGHRHETQALNHGKWQH